MVPFLRRITRDVDDSHGVVAPMCDRHIAVVARHGDHLRQRARLHQSHDGILLCVDDGHGRRILGVEVIATSIVRHPKVAPPMGEGTLNGFPIEGVQFRSIMSKWIQVRGFTPEQGVAFVELMPDDFEFRIGASLIDYGLCPFQGIHIVLMPVGMDVHRLWGTHVLVAIHGVVLGVILFL